MATAPDLNAVLTALISRVDRRIANTGGPAGDRAQVRRAAEQVPWLRGRLGLGTFRGALGPSKSKPQFVLLFDRQGGPAVLKVYGRSRPGEARAQQVWSDHRLRSVPIIDAGDDPVSWLLMRPVDIAPLGPAGSHTLRAVTVELADLLVPAHRVGSIALARASAVGRGLERLDDAIGRHLGHVVDSLLDHGYEVPGNWAELVGRLCGAVTPTLLHGDLVEGNVVRDASDGRLRLLDACGYLGPPEFDAARWAARAGGPDEAERALCTWLHACPAMDQRLAYGFLGLELLMQAGVGEVVKNEQGRSVEPRDPLTLAHLRSSSRFLEKTA